MVYVRGFGDIDEMDLAKERSFNKDLNITIKFYADKRPQARNTNNSWFNTDFRKYKFKGSLSLRNADYHFAVKRSEELNKRMKEINKRRNKK